jgi:hypothetical protein
MNQESGMLTLARRIGESVILTIDGMKLIRIMLGLPVFQLPSFSAP